MGVKILYTFFTLYFIQATIRGSNTLKRHKKPKSFPGSAARHSWATLSASLVPRQCGATPLGDIISLFRSTTVLCGTLERHYQPLSFHDSAAQHPWATLQASLVPRQCGAAPLGDITSLSRSTTARRDTLGRHYLPFSFPAVMCGTLERHYQPLSFHDSAAQHS